MRTIEKKLDSNMIYLMLEADDTYALKDYLSDNGFENNISEIITALTDAFNNGQEYIDEIVNRLNTYWNKSQELPKPEWSTVESSSGSIYHRLIIPRTYDRYSLVPALDFPLTYEDLHPNDPTPPADHFIILRNTPIESEAVGDGTLEECIRIVEQIFYQEILTDY